MGLLEATEYMERLDRLEELCNSQSEYILQLEHTVSQMKIEIDVLKSARSNDSKAIEALKQDIEFIAEDNSTKYRSLKSKVCQFADRSRRKGYEERAKTLIGELLSAEHISVKSYREQNKISKGEMSMILVAAKRINSNVNIISDPTDKRRKIITIL